MSVFFEAVQNGDAETVWALLIIGVEKNECLHEAVIRGDETSVELLLNVGADMSFNKDNVLLIITVTMNGDANILRLLIKAGALVSGVNVFGVQAAVQENIQSVYQSYLRMEQIWQRPFPLL